MEISKEIVDQIFLSLKGAPGHEPLEQLLSELYRLNIGVSNSPEIKTIEREIYPLISKALNGVHYQRKGALAELISITVTVNKYLLRAIETPDTKSILVFLSVACYLPFNFDLYLTQKKVASLDRKVLMDHIKQSWQGDVRIETNVPEDGSYFELNSKAESLVGIQEENVKKVYNFIQAAERGMGFHFDYLIENLLKFIFYFDLQTFIERLNSADHSETSIIFLQNLPKKDLLRIPSHPGVTAKWLLFETLRQIIKHAPRQNNPFTVEECVAAEACLAKLRTNYFNIYSQAVPFFADSKLFNAALGSDISKATLSQRMSVLSDLLPIDARNTCGEQRLLLLSPLYDNLSTDEYRQSLATLYRKWRKLYDDILEKEDEYLNSLLLTDYCDFVVWYYAEHKNEGEMLDLIKDILNKLTWINSEWLCSKTQYITRFHLYLTDLFVLSHVFKMRGFDTSQLKPDLQFFLESLSTEQLNENASSGLKIITSNLGGTVV